MCLQLDELMMQEIMEELGIPDELKEERLSERTEEKVLVPAGA